MTVTNNFINVCDKEPLGCDNPPHPNKSTAHVDCAVSVSCLGRLTKAAWAKIQEKKFGLGTPRKDARLMTTEILELLLNKLPPAAQRAFQVPDNEHNLIAAAELIDAGCRVYLHEHGCKIEYEGEILYKGGRDPVNRLWRPNIDPDATN